MIGRRLIRGLAVTVGAIPSIISCNAATHATAPSPSPKIFVTAADRSLALKVVDRRSDDKLHHMAEELYIATSRDAQTFKAALLIPEIRQKLEQVLGPLSDEKLKALAAQSNAEAIYWYKYMQGLEHQ